MPRKRTGSVEYIEARSGETQGHYRARITLDDGKRKRIDLDPGPKSPQAERRARERAAHWSERARAEGIVAVPRSARQRLVCEVGETVSGWFEPFAEAREARGLTSVGDDRGRFRVHVDPVIGALPMAAVTRDDVEAVVRSLDAKVRAGELSWKTANNVWVLMTTMFAEAVRSKVVALRCRSDNPCRDVAPPDRGIDRAKCYLYPSEFSQLVACDRVPLRWRRMLAVSIYLGTRAGELDALEWSDVDLARGNVHVHRAIDRSKKGETKCTKTGTSRRFKIEPEILPLLRAMHAERGDSERVFPPLKLTGRPDKLRAFMRRAGIERAELFARSATLKPLGWHDLRATCATWMAVRGDEPLKIMHRLGHKNMSTTMIYVREAEQIAEGFGDPFPPLPASLLGVTARGDSLAGNGQRIGQRRRKSSESLSGTRDSNP